MRRLMNPVSLPTEISPLEGSERQAAVALILWGESGELLLIRRADHPLDPWSGHMALPGGRHENDDTDLLTTAMRETREEVGIALGMDSYLGALPPVRARSRVKIDPMKITPFVFRLAGERPLPVPNYEVAEVIWLPLAALTEPARKTEILLSHEGAAMRLPAIQVNEHKIWGLTYGIISNLLTSLVPDEELDNE